MLPLIALAAPLIGGAMSLAGGAMSLTGGVMAAGSTMAGIAADAASGVIGAASRLTGGGKSAPEPEAREPADQSTSDEQGAKALPPGVKLNKNGVMIQDSGGPGGGQILPGQFDEDGQLKSMDDRLESVTADRSGASPVNQILDYVKVIAANTARTAMGIGALMQQSAASTAQDNIDDSKNKTQPKQGMVSKVFGGLTTRMRKISDSLGGVAKFMLKGLGLAGLIYLFKKHEETVTKAVANVFEFFHNMYEKIQNSDDPLGDLLKYLKEKIKEIGNSIAETMKTWWNETALPLLEEMFATMLESAKRIATEFFINTDDKVVRESKQTIAATNQNFADYIDSGQGGKDVDVFKNKKGEYIENAALNDPLEIYQDTRGSAFKKSFMFSVAGTRDSNDANTIKLNKLLDKKIESMRDISKRTDGRVQFEGFPDLSKHFFPGDFPGLTFNKVMNAVPIIDGFISTDAELQDFSPDQSAGITKAMEGTSAAKQIRENLARMTQMIHTGTYNAEEFSALQQTNIELGQNRTSSSYLNASKTPGITTITDKNKTNYNNPSLMFDEPLSSINLKRLLRNTETYLRTLERQSAGGSTLLVDSSSSDNRMTKQGDTIQMAMSVDSSDYTARLLTDMREVSV